MDILPTSNQERFFGRLLIPLKAYVLIAPVWLFYWAMEVRTGHTGSTGLSVYLLVIYAICIPFFLLAALIQFFARWNRQALISISFALVASIIFVILWQLVKSSGEH